MHSPLEVLKKYWNYHQFRPLQEEIIDSVISGVDTFVLLPTGGGKSLCFQVPALVLPHLTIVVTPLVSLMKDQVKRLRSLGIRAEAIFSGLYVKDLERIYHNCLQGDTKLLYLSPERLKSETFLSYLENFKLSLIVVDEAHCISQWGYDFRPSYLEINTVRVMFPDIPLMALTASATPEVVNDIISSLMMDNPNVFKKSFLRENISFVVRKETDKRLALKRLVEHVKGTGILYARSRKKSVDLAMELTNMGVKAESYHAGLSSKILNGIQDRWMHNKTRVIAATTAFGMGIDKPDVRFVAHLDIPSSLEEYYQEAGRAGRDGNKSYAVLYYSDTDMHNLLESVNETYPDSSELIQLYKDLCNYYQVAAGPQNEVYYDFDIHQFSKEKSYSVKFVLNGMAELARQELLILTDAILLPSRVRIVYSANELYDFQLRFPEYDYVIESLLRLYGGILHMPVKVNMQLVCDKARLTIEQLHDALNRLDLAGVIEYYPQKDKPQISFGEYRYPVEDIVINTDQIQFLKSRYIQRIQAMISFVESPICRNIILLQYFGEPSPRECGNCDICIENKKNKSHNHNNDACRNYIIDVITQGNASLKIIQLSSFFEDNKQGVMQALQELMDEDIVYLDDFELKLRH